MPKTRKPYPPEFREQMVALVRAGRTPEELSRQVALRGLSTVTVLVHLAFDSPQRA